LKTLFCLIVLALLALPMSVLAKSILSPDYGINDGDGPAVVAEWTYFDESLDLLNYADDLKGRARPDEASRGSVILSLPIHNEWTVSYRGQNFKGEVVRSSEPFKVSSRAQGHLLEASLSGKRFRDWDLGLFANVELVDQDRTTIDCFARGGIILGGNCPNANFRLFDADASEAAGELVYQSVLSTKAEQLTVSAGASLKREVGAFTINQSLSLSISEIEFETNSPLFDIADPAILDLTLEGRPLRVILQDLRSELPQTDPWYEASLEYKVGASYALSDRVTVMGNVSGIVIERKDYDASESDNSDRWNLGLDVSIWFQATNISWFYLRAEAYRHYLAGYEPLLYNRKSASYFDHPYGQVSAGFVLNF